MADARHRRLADTLTRYSCDLQPGETVLIEATDVPEAFVRALVRSAREAGAHPLVTLKNQRVHRELLMDATEEQMAAWATAEAARMDLVDAWIGVRGAENVAELADVPPEKMALYERVVFQQVHLDRRVAGTKWVVLRWPTSSMAQLAGMSTSAFEDFYFGVCAFDYPRLSGAMDPLVELLEATDQVRLVAPGTDLRFSLHGIPVVKCDGHRNVPDGEVFTAPVRDSVEGTIRYNAPSLYRGVTHEDVELDFEGGRIVRASSSQPGHLEEVLDADEGARYIGEFALGLHPGITRPMNDILFDEKIAGSLHFTPGQAYDVADNGNRSQIHWDLVLMMAPEHGGGEIYFDETLVRKDGRFVLDRLAALNPEALQAPPASLARDASSGES